MVVRLISRTVCVECAALIVVCFAPACFILKTRVHCLLQNHQTNMSNKEQFLTKSSKLRGPFSMATWTCVAKCLPETQGYNTTSLKQETRVGFRLSHIARGRGQITCKLGSELGWPWRITYVLVLHKKSTATPSKRPRPPGRPIERTTETSCSAAHHCRSKKQFDRRSMR